MRIDISGLQNWECVAEFAVGGLEWVGFSVRRPEKLLCISSQKTTVFDCEEKTLNECDCEYDETSLLAICDLLPDEEIAISGQYGGRMLQMSPSGEAVKVHTSAVHTTTVTFIDDMGRQSTIFQNYGFYTCGFNCTGKYFVFSHDGGISILRRV